MEQDYAGETNCKLWHTRPINWWPCS